MTAHDQHDHHHGHEDGEASELSETELRVRALQTILIEKGYADPAALDAIVETYEAKLGPISAPASWRAPGPIPCSASSC